MINGIDLNEKVKVFISSMCGVEKYDKVRHKLKSKLEATGFAKVYTFETVKRASTLNVEQEYLYELDASDVCIFLIDNADGVPPGVLKEHLRAKAQQKKSLYIFCDERQKRPTEIEKEITGPGGLRYCKINKFNDFAEIGYKSLIDEIGRIFINYCNKKLVDPEFSISTGNIVEIDPVTSESLDKQIFKNIDITKRIITNELYSRSNRKIKNTSDLDEHSSDFLKVLFGSKSIKDFNAYFLLSGLEGLQSENLHKVVTERWKAIQYYWMGDLNKSIKYKKEALKLARDLKQPNWLVQDILIDLRNLKQFKNIEENTYEPLNPAQIKLKNERTALFYPLLDRYENSFYKAIVKQFEKSAKRSPYTTTFGNNIDLYGDYIANIYIMAIFNGSLTHLIGIMDRLKWVAFVLCQEYSDWEFRILLLKMTFLKGNKTDVRDTINLVNDVYGKMNIKDSMEIYGFCKNSPIEYQREIAQLLAFQHLGYYFSDDYYQQVWGEIYEIIDRWINSKDRIPVIGSYIFDALRANLLRLDNNLIVVDILSKILSNDLQSLYDDVLKIITDIDINKLNRENMATILNWIKRFVRNDTIRDNCQSLGNAILSICKANPELTDKLDELVMKNMAEFYKGSYTLEVKVRSQLESEEYINKFIREIGKRNKSQGRDGRYEIYIDNPYKTIEKIIKINEIEVDKDMIESIVSICCDTLYAKNQTLRAKIQAINLITFMRLISNEELFDFKQLINQIEKNKDLVFSGEEILMLDKANSSTLHFNFTMMRLLFNSIESGEIVRILNPYTKLEDFEKLEALKTIVSMFEYECTERMDEKTMLLILQFTLGLSNDKNHNIRYYSVKALLNILNETNRSQIIQRLLEIMDYDSSYIKNLIISYSDKLKNIDNGAYNYILAKALVDNHYYIREQALALQEIQ